MHDKLLFGNLLFVLDSGCSRFRNKKTVQKAITDNGGTISYILNKAVSFFVAYYITACAIATKQ